MDALRDERQLESARRAFGTELRAHAPALSMAVFDELEAECAPVLETLLGAAHSATASDEHESLAMAALFGRRVATLGESPTTALASIESIVRAASLAEVALTGRQVLSLRAATMEGFAAAVDERARTQMIERAGQSLMPVTVSARVVLLMIAGCDDADTIAQALARLGRNALDSDAKACLVHACFAREPERDVIAEIAAFDGSAQMIGARAIFSGSPVFLHALAPYAETLSVASSFEDALRRGLDAAEQEVRPSSILSRGLKRLRR